MKNLNILIIGPFPSPITGLSFSNQTVYCWLKKEKYKVDRIDTSDGSEFKKGKQGQFQLKKAAFLFKYLFIYKLVRSELIYYTPGQTFFGLIKYAPFILVARLLGKKIILHLHGNFLGKELKQQKGQKKILMQRLIKQSDTAIVLSEGLRNNFKELLPPEKIKVLTNFIKDEVLMPNNKVESKDYKQIKLLFFSNLIEEKGINILLKSLLKLQQNGVEIPLEIAGKKDPNNQEFYTLLSMLKKVNYLGVITGEEKAQVLWRNNVFCLPTFYEMEGQPISLLENMAAANHIITTPIPGILDILPNEGNSLVKAHSEESLTNCLLELISNHQIISYSGKNNRKVAENFRLNIFGEKLEEIINNVSSR